jgi:outer membrane protein assembly factor BamB
LRFQGPYQAPSSPATWWIVALTVLLAIPTLGGWVSIPQVGVASPRVTTLASTAPSSLAVAPETLVRAPSASPAPTLPPGGDFTTYLGNIERTSSSSSESLINLSTASQLRPLWSYSTGAAVQSQPVEQNGVTYLGSHNGYEFALRANNGTLLWKTFLGMDTNDSQCGNLGVTSTAAIVGNVLYVDGGFPYLYALNTSTGAVEWRTPIGGTDAQGFYDWASPLVYGGEAYIGISSNCDLPLVPAGMDEVSLATHAVVASFNSSVPDSNGSSIWGSPSLNTATNTLFAATGNAYTEAQSTYSDSVVSLNATTLAVQASWQIPASQDKVDADFGASPTLFTPAGGYPMVTVPDKNGYLYAFYQSNLTLAWEQKICCEDGQSDHFSTAWGGGYVYAVNPKITLGGVAYNSSVEAFNPLTGAIVWQDGFNESSFYGYAAPLYVNGVLIVPDQGTLLVLNATDGDLLAQPTIGGQSQAAASVSRGEVFAGSTDDDVVAFDLALTSSAEQTNGSGTGPLNDSFNVTAAGGLPPYSYLWSFGDGDSSNLQSPDHTYSSIGTYEVNVSTTDFAGTVAVAHLTVHVLAQAYEVTFIQTGLVPRTQWAVTLGGDLQSSQSEWLNFSEPNGSYPFTVGELAGYSPSRNSGTINVTGANQSESIVFAITTYSIAITETGLPSGTDWGVSVDGTVYSSISTTITFVEPNGTYALSVETAPGFVPLAPTGSVSVSGSNQTISVTYGPATETVTFTQTGLRAGTDWAVRLGAVQHTSTTPEISFVEPVGTVAFAVKSVAGYSTNPLQGQVTVGGSAQDVAVIFTPVYSVTFTMTGLPSGTWWAVSVGGLQHTSTTSSIAFVEPNGTYAFAVRALPNYTASPAPGSLTVYGANRSLPVNFSPDVNYSVSFSMTGLPVGTSWAVSVGGIQHKSTSSSLSFEEPNGTYPYATRAIAGWSVSPRAGPLVVHGANLSIDVTFTPVYSVTFSETGLASGTSWAVELGGVQVTSLSTSVVFLEPNGTFSYLVKAVPGFSDSPSKGVAAVGGNSLAFPITFSAKESGPVTGRPASSGASAMVELRAAMRSEFSRT